MLIQNFDNSGGNLQLPMKQDNQVIKTTPPEELVYQKPLPSTCIDFRSIVGKKLFAESLMEGNMNIFFELSAQFLTQAEPAYCAVSTLVMTLNTLRIDPGKRWKGIWKWYTEDMLVHCKPLEKVKESGISFREFACLCQCNGLTVAEQYADSGDLEQFRATVLRSVRSNDEILVVNYHRETLNQTGTGHFSPIAGYHSTSDKVLILDVARYKYPPHWVHLELLWAAMNRKIESTNLTRGYCLITSPNTRTHSGIENVVCQCGNGRPPFAKIPTVIVATSLPQWFRHYVERFRTLFLNWL